VSKKIKICFFSPASYPFFVPENKSIHGGAEFQMYLLATKLAKNPDFNVLFIVGDYQQKGTEFFENIRLIKGFKHLDKENIISKLIKALKLFYIYMKLSPDVIITTTANSTIGIASFYKFLFRKKHIHRTAHLIDVNFEWIKENGFLGKIYQKGLLTADIILTQNQEHKDILYQTHKKQSIVLKNAFPVGDYPSLEKKYILWVGRFQQWKNPDLFVKLAQQIPVEKFVMICPYNPSDYKAWKKLNAEAEKISNLTFIEKVPFHEIQPYFNQAKIFVNTSDYEGFPNTFLQSAQGKTPIVSLNVNPDNFLNEYNCGYFCENNFDLLLEKTKTLLSNPEKIEQKGENAFEYLKQNHDINKIGKQLEEIIYGLVNNYSSNT